jgi:hypothetical protein
MTFMLYVSQINPTVAKQLHFLCKNGYEIVMRDLDIAVDGRYDIISNFAHFEPKMPRFIGRNIIFMVRLI